MKKCMVSGCQGPEHWRHFDAFDRRSPHGGRGGGCTASWTFELMFVSTCISSWRANSEAVAANANSSPQCEPCPPTRTDRAWRLATGGARAQTSMISMEVVWICCAVCVCVRESNRGERFGHERGRHGSVRSKNQRDVSLGTRCVVLNWPDIWASFKF